VSLLLPVESVGQNDIRKSGIAKSQTDIKGIKLFPNPAGDHFGIHQLQGGVKYITVNDIIGKEIKRIEVRNQSTYDVSDLEKGVYIIRIFDPNDELIKALRLSKA
jgi:hypothetical protein